MQSLTMPWEDLRPRPDVHFLIATAVPVERDAVLEVMTPLMGRDLILKVPYQESTYFVGAIGRYPCALVLGEAGSDTRKGSALEIQAGIDRWAPLAVIAPGIAFGRRFDANGQEKQVPGDILVSTQLYPYHHTKLTPDTVEDRGPHPEASAVLLDRVRNLFWHWTTATGQERGPVLGPLLTGPHVVNDAIARDQLFRRFPGAIGGEMEATGVYSACSRNATDWIVLKAVCDWGAEKADDHQAFAARNAAALLLALLSEGGLNPEAFRRRPPALSPSPSVSGWERIDFAAQADLGPALAGDSMGPAHVKACPPLPDVEEIVRHLDEAGAVAVVGPSGSGKSMAAWHAAYRLHQAGWVVYTRGFVAGLPPDTDQRVLLLADDVQAFPLSAGSAALVTTRRRLLLVSTEPVPGIRRTVRILPELAVAALADGLTARAGDLLPAIHRLDPSVGEGPGQLPIEHRIEDAKRRSKLPWQFMFNLGSGHLRLDAALKELAQASPRDVVLFAIAARQLATMDAGADLTWLSAMLERRGIDTANLDTMLADISSRVALVRTDGRVSTPHPQVADRILAAWFYGPGSGMRRGICWELFDDLGLPLGGLAWLASKTPTPLTDADELVDRLRHRCRESANIGQAAFLLATLLSHWCLKPSRLTPDLETMRGWMAAAVPEHAHGLRSLVNELMNGDHSKSFEAESSGATPPPRVSQQLVSGIPPTEVARWANDLALDEAGAARISLLERLSNAGSSEWRAAVGALLDGSKMSHTVRTATKEQLDTVGELIVALLLLNKPLARELVRSVSPLVVDTMRQSFTRAYWAMSDVFHRVLGFWPRFLRHRDPDTEQRALMNHILHSVGAESLAKQLSNSKRRDWNPWSHFNEILREATPDLASTVAAGVDVAPLVSLARTLIHQSPYEVDELLKALALAGREPAATLVRLVHLPEGKMTSIGAYMAPDAAITLVDNGVTFSLDLGGGLPRWPAATVILGEMALQSQAAARTLLRANLEQLADGLIFRHANGGEGATVFLEVALHVDESALLEAFQRIDLEQARTSWAARSIGTAQEREAMERILALAVKTGGAIGEVAAAVHAAPERQPETSEPPGNDRAQ